MLLLEFQIGRERYALDTGEVLEVAPRTELRKLPHVPEYVSGLMSYRGGVVPVIDLSQLLSGEPASRLLSTRTILVKFKGFDGEMRVLGLLAERATDMIRCEPKDLQAPGISTAEAPYLGEILQDQSGMIQRVTLDRLLPPMLQHMLFEAGEEA